MPDYEQKNIPTLDDIIEDEDAEDTGTDDAAQNDLTEEESSPDLFSEESIDDTIEDTADAVAESFDDDIDDHAANTGEQHDIAQQHEEPDYQQAAQTSVQVTYQEIYDKSINLSPAKATDADGADAHIDEALTETVQAAIEPIELEEIVGSVVKQLLPDLEQQLRFLIQRALEEKLPRELIREEIIDPADTLTASETAIDPDSEPDTSSGTENT